MQTIVEKVQAAQAAGEISLTSWALNDFGDSAINSINSAIALGQKIAPFAFALSCIGIGFMFFGGRKGSEAAKPWLLYLFIGMFIIFGATSLATFAKTSTGF